MPSKPVSSRARARPLKEQEGSHEEFWATLFESHWVELVNFVRRQGYSNHDAEDHTQAFFAKLLRTERLAASALPLETLRAYLFTALKRFLIDRHRHQTSLKRGGPTLPLSVLEMRPNVLGSDSFQAPSRPDIALDRQWARRLINEALDTVEKEYLAKGKGALFHAMKPHLQCHAAKPPHTQVARQLGMRVGTARLAAHRIRQRFAAVMRSKIDSTVSSSREAEEEIHHLLNVFSTA